MVSHCTQQQQATRPAPIQYVGTVRFVEPIFRIHWFDLIYWIYSVLYHIYTTVVKPSYGQLSKHRKNFGSRPAASCRPRHCTSNWYFCNQSRDATCQSGCWGRCGSLFAFRNYGRMCSHFGDIQRQKMAWPWNLGLGSFRVIDLLLVWLVDFCSA